MKRAISITCIAIVVAGCGDARTSGRDSGSPPTDGGTGDGFTIEQFCDAVSRAGCDANQRCCSDPARVPATVEECLSVTLPRCTMSAENDAFRTGRVRIDEAAAAAYLETYRAATASCVGVSAYDVTGILEGTVGEDGDCSVSEGDFSNAASCADGLGCAIDYTTYAGTCRPLGLLDSSCAGGEAPCGPGLYCDYAGDSRCMILRDDGESCAADYECWSYYCNGTSCAPRPGDPYYCL